MTSYPPETWSRNVEFLARAALIKTLLDPQLDQPNAPTPCAVLAYATPDNLPYVAEQHGCRNCRHCNIIRSSFANEDRGMLGAVARAIQSRQLYGTPLQIPIDQIPDAIVLRQLAGDFYNVRLNLPNGTSDEYQEQASSRRDAVDHARRRYQSLAP